MPELWLPPERRVALWDPTTEQVRVIGWRPGPAGVSVVDPAPGLTVAVDHADPTTLTEVTVDVDDGRVAPAAGDLLPVLVGDEAAETVARMAREARASRPVRLRRGASGSLREPDDRLRPVDERHRVFARFALATDLGEDAALPEARRAVARLEAALAAEQLGLDAVAPGRSGLRLLAVAAPPTDPKAGYRYESFLAALSPQLRAALPLEIERALAALRGWRTIDRRSIRRVTQALPAPAEQLMAPLAASAPAAVGASRRSERPVPVVGPHAAWAWLDRGGNVRVTATNGVGWARVFRSADRLLLALAPLRPEPAAGPGHHALLVVPAVSDPSELVVDLVDEPVAGRPAPTHDLVRLAVLAGRDAARLTRLGDGDATAAWAESAEHWRALGDPQRQRLARHHGRRDDRSSPGFVDPPPALLADEP